MKESKYLKDNIQNIQKLFVIPALRGFETKSLGRLIRLSKIRQYEDGECIIEQGGTDSWLYFLLSGKIRVVKDNMEICRIDKIGELFGEMRMIDSLSRSTSIYAVGDTVCLAVNAEATEKLPSAGDAGNFLIMLYRVIAEYLSYRLRLTNEELIKAKKQCEILKTKIR